MILEKQDSYRLPLAGALLFLVRIEILCSETGVSAGIQFALILRLKERRISPRRDQIPTILTDEG